MKNSNVLRFLAVLLAFLLCIVCFAGCGGEKHPAEDTSAEDVSGSDSTSPNETTKQPESSGTTKSPQETVSYTSSEYSPTETVSSPAVLQETPREARGYFDDAVFIGDSVSLRLSYYEASADALGDAQFLVSGSLGSTNALWDLNKKDAVHPQYHGAKTYVWTGVAASGAHKVYLMLGMNDIDAYGIAESIKNYKTLIGKILSAAPGVTIVVESVTPMTATSTRVSKGLNNTKIMEYNQKMAEECAANGWYFLNVASVLRDADGNLVSSYCSDADGMGIHFTDTGCAIWVDYLYTHAIP